MEFSIVLKAGSSAVKICKETKPNGEYFRVCYYAGGKRERLTLSSLEEAKTEARPGRVAWRVIRIEPPLSPPLPPSEPSVEKSVDGWSEQV